MKITTTLLLLLFSTIFCTADNEFLTEGLAWKQKGNMVEAYKHFEKSFEMYPNDIQSQTEFANAAYELQRYVNAIPVYEKMLSADKKNIQALIRLAKMYSYSSQKYKTVEYGERAIRLKPTTDEQLMTLGDAFYFVKNYPQAIKLYTAIKDQDAVVMHKIAKAYSKMGSHNSATNSFEKLIAAKKKPNASVHFEYGNSLFQNGQYKEATTQYLKAKELGFYNVLLINQSIAGGFMALKAYEPALEFFQYAKQSDPYNKNLNLDIADCYIKLGKFNDARKVISDLQEIYPNDGDLMYNFAMVYYKQGNSAKAETYFTKAFEMKPSLKSLRYTKNPF